MPKLNKKLLNETKKFITENAASFYMNDWVSSDGNRWDIGGAMLMLDLGISGKDLYRMCFKEFTIKFATKALWRGLKGTLGKEDSMEWTKAPYPALFYVDMWPPPIRERYIKARTDEDRAAAGCEAIDWFKRVHR